MLNLCKIACRIKKKCCNVVCELINLPQYFNLTKNYLFVLYSTLVTYYTLFLGHPNRIGCFGRQTNRMLLVSVTYILKYAGTCSNAACPRAIDIADYPRFNLLLHSTFPLVILFLLVVLLPVLPLLPPTLAARQKPKCCRYGLGPSCSSGSLTSLPLSSISPLPLSTPPLCLSPPPPALPSVAVTRHEIDLFLFCVKCRAQNSQKKKPKKKLKTFHSSDSWFRSCLGLARG